MPKYLVFILVLSLSSIAIRAQDATPKADANTTNQTSEASPALTADGVRACPGESKTSPLPDGVYRVGNGVLPPKPKSLPEVSLSDEAREYSWTHHVKNFVAISVVRLTVDEKGQPRDLCIAKEAGLGLDRNAIEAAAKYRFWPATLNGKPVPVRIATEMRFMTN